MHITLLTERRLVVGGLSLFLLQAGLLLALEAGSVVVGANLAAVCTKEEQKGGKVRIDGTTWVTDATRCLTIGEQTYWSGR